MISLYQAHKKIYPRSVSGVFANWRWGMVFLTQIVFYGLPWLEWGQRQMVLFDLGARRFYIFGLVLYPQDFIYLTGMLVVSALSLFLFTAVAGRLWCGYACPQTVYTEIFLWIERKFEGDRSAQMRRDAQPLSLDKAWRKAGKQLAWVAVALWTGFTFVGYFTPIRSLGLDFAQGNVGPWGIFWTGFYAFATYGNAGFMREQVCKYMCPYARFQSAMFDKDTLIVTYDAERGEPRGARSRKADPAKLNLGACTDCSLCVQVCPTGIDIRKGLQYECIGCAACIDVCNGVMDKMEYPRGLIRYDTENSLAQNLSRGQVWRRVLRPRVIIYSVILLGLATAFVAGLAMRSPVRLDVVRDRATLAQVVEHGVVENIYRLHVMNATESPQRYRLSVQGLPGIVLQAPESIEVAPAEARWVTVAARVPPETAERAGPGVHAVEFVAEQLPGSGEARAARVASESTFIVPR